jgi:hypothetical protein
MRFDYKRYRQARGADIERPVIQIILRNLRHPLSTPIAYEALVDSGSDRNIFPAAIADLLGINLIETDHVQYVGGVVAGERRSVYFHPVEIQVGGLDGPAFMTSAGFMPEFSKGGYGLLGRIGFFNEFTFIKFKDADHMLEIGKRRR